MKKRSTTTRHHHLRTVKSGKITPVRQHPMKYWGSLKKTKYYLVNPHTKKIMIDKEFNTQRDADRYGFSHKLSGTPKGYTSWKGKYLLRDKNNFQKIGFKFEGKDSDMSEKDIKKRLEYLRGEIRKERISYGEIAELQSLAPYIEEGDVELLEWAGVPEFPDSDGDGVPDHKDCDPKDPTKQDFKVHKENVVDYIMEYEGGNPTVEDYLELMSYMVRTGQACLLQGSIYGRPAQALIEQGILDRRGIINWSKVDELEIDTSKRLYGEE